MAWDLDAVEMMESTHEDSRPSGRDSDQLPDSFKIAIQRPDTGQRSIYTEYVSHIET